MIRTQVQLTEDQTRKVKELAQHEGTSISEVIRQALDRRLEECDDSKKWERALAIGGRFNSGLHDVSVRHDDYLAEDFR